MAQVLTLESAYGTADPDSGKPQIRGERHFNVRKAQLLTGAAVGGTTLATGAVAMYALGDAGATLFGVNHAFWVLMACTSAGDASMPLICVTC